MSDLFSPEDADRLLSGSGEGELARALAGLHRLVTPVNAPASAAIVAKMSAAAAAAAATGALDPLRWLRPRRIWLHKVVASAATTATLATAGGLAATGHLPAPVQRVVSRAVSHVGISIPTDSASRTPRVVAPPTSTSTTASTTTMSSTASTTTTTVACAASVIVSAHATGVPLHPGVENGGAHVTFTATTRGDIATVTVVDVPGKRLLPLAKVAANTWSASFDVVGGHHEGLPVVFTASGCGTDTRTTPMVPEPGVTIIGPRAPPTTAP